MAETLGTKGAELNLLVRQGATQGPYNMKLRKADGNPIDITAAVFRAQIRKTANSNTLPGVTFTFNILTPLDGEVEWSLPDTSTELLNAGEDSELEEESQYVWDMEVELSSGRVIPLTYGIVQVFREVSKVDV
jgi:hypothetical protein